MRGSSLTKFRFPCLKLLRMLKPEYNLKDKSEMKMVFFSTKRVDFRVISFETCST